MKKTAVLLSILFLQTAIYQLAVAQENKPIQSFILENGLTVYLLEDHELPRVTGMVVTRAGAKNDPADATGMAHYMEHMLFKGTTQIGTTDWQQEKPWIDTIFSLYDQLGQTTDEAKRAALQSRINEASVKANEYAIPNELSNIIKECGGTGMNAGTGPDQTVFFNSFPPSEMNKWLEIYSHRFMDPVFRSFQSELEVVYEEKNMYADNFFMNLLEKFQKSFFKVHPYGQQPMIGTIEHLKNPSLTKMKKFFDTWYVPNNMALILVGDFSASEAMPMIQEKFGRWEQGPVPASKIFTEQPFSGREQVEFRLSPIKIGILGFRTSPIGHPDEFALKICTALLNNPNTSGLLDKLTVEEKLLGSNAIQIPYTDLGACAIILIPKLLGQSLEDAEALVLGQVEKLCKGEFEDWMFEAAKLSLYKQQLRELENADYTGRLIAQAFTLGKDPNEIYTYSDRIAKLTKEDVVAVAQKYFGKDYLAFYSKMGFPKAEKIDKPAFTPVIGKNDIKSSYASRVLETPSGRVQTKPIGFGTDCRIVTMANGVKLYHTHNPMNGIFTLSIQYPVDKAYQRMLPYMAELVSFAGTEEYPGIKFKEALDRLGCSVSFNDNENIFTLSLDGPEENFVKAMVLINGIVDHPIVEESKMALIAEGDKASRKVEKSTPDAIADALFEYVKYGSNSDYLDRPTMKELNVLKSDSLLACFKHIVSHAAVVFYVGKTDPDVLRSMLETGFFSNRTLSPMLPLTFKPVSMYPENTVFFTDVKKARQSKIYFYKKGPAFNTAESAGLSAFNMYFGGDFSGLVLQEIREYRSFAYTAGATISKPKLSGDPLVFYGYVGTQADKTNEAIQVFTGLINDMPQKRERTELIRRYLTLGMASQRPTFREIPQTVFYWELLGYQSDPVPGQIKQLEGLEFNKVNEVYEKVVKPGPLVISIAGNKKRIDFKDLGKYGRIEKVKLSDIFRD